MKIRRKVALTFTGLTSVILLVSFSFIYFLTRHYTKEDFYLRLEEKAELIAEKHFKQDEYSKEVYQDVLNKNSISLPESSELIVDAKNSKNAYTSLIRTVPVDAAKRLISGNKARFQSNDRQSVGLYYPDNQGTFIIVASAFDTIGTRRQQVLFRILVVIFSASLLFMYFVGKYYAFRVFSPVNYILKEVKNINANNLKKRLREEDSNDEMAELSRVLNSMLDRLEHSFDGQKNFISNASHELKNPLTAIIGETEIALLKPRTSEEYVNSLNKISFEADRLNLLTRNLLSLAQSDFVLNERDKEKVRFDELLWEIQEDFEKTPCYSRLLFNISEIPEDIDQYTINGNHDLLKIALVNLIDNACKFSDKKEVNVDFRAFRGTIEIIVKDQGIGIPEEELASLCQPFFRASNARQYKGSGIGLSLADKIIDLHKGHFHITSQQGNGTEVKITFTVQPSTHQS